LLWAEGAEEEAIVQIITVPMVPVAVEEAVEE
jgi:hypothetical protein